MTEDEVEPRRVEIRDPANSACLSMTMVEQNGEDTIFRVKLARGLFSGATDASTYYVGPPTAFFRGIAEEWRGWTGRKTWRDETGMLLLEAANPHGKVMLYVSIFGDPGSETRFSSSLSIESAALDGVARDIGELFKNDRSLSSLERSPVSRSLWSRMLCKLRPVTHAREET